VAAEGGWQELGAAPAATERCRQAEAHSASDGHQGPSNWVQTQECDMAAAAVERVTGGPSRIAAAAAAAGLAQVVELLKLELAVEQQAEKSLLLLGLRLPLLWPSWAQSPGQEARVRPVLERG